MYKKYKDQGLKVVSISMEDPKTLREFAQRKGATFPILTDPTGKVFMQYQAESIPLNAFIDSQGRAVEVVVGFDPSEGEAHLDGMAKALLEDAKATRS